MRTKDESMKQITKEVYYCEHCKKHGLSKHHMERHEKYCMKDPKNIPACFNCTNLGRDWIDTGGSCRGPYYFYCKAQGSKQIHNLAAVRRGLIDKHPDEFADSELMPVACPHLVSGMPLFEF